MIEYTHVSKRATENKWGKMTGWKRGHPSRHSGHESRNFFPGSHVTVCVDQLMKSVCVFTVYVCCTYSAGSLNTLSQSHTHTRMRARTHTHASALQGGAFSFNLSTATAWWYLIRKRTFNHCPVITKLQLTWIWRFPHDCRCFLS